MHKSIILCIFLGLMTFTTAKISKVFVVQRHCDRSPMKDDFEIPALKDLRMDESLLVPTMTLTSKGEKQCFDIGSHVSEKYMDFEKNEEKPEGKFLNPDFSDSEYKFYASGAKRTLRTAEAFSLGLFTHDDTKTAPQTVPIRSKDKKDDRLLREVDVCTKLIHEFGLTEKDEVDPESEVAKKFNEIQEKLELSEEITTFFQFYRLYDFLNVYNSHDLLDEEEVKDVKKTFDEDIEPLMNQFWAERYSAENIKNRAGTYILKDIAEKMENREDFTKFYYYATHDSALSAILTTLGLNSFFEDDSITSRIPEYGSMLVFELNIDDENAKTNIRVYFKNGLEAKELEGPLTEFGCDEDVCTYDKFISLVENTYISEEEWCSVCGNTERKECIEINNQKTLLKYNNLKEYANNCNTTRVELQEKIEERTKTIAVLNDEIEKKDEEIMKQSDRIYELENSAAGKDESVESIKSKYDALAKKYDKKESEDTMIIIALIAVSGILLLVLCVLVYYLWYSKKKTKQQPPQKYQKVSVLGETDEDFVNESPFLDTELKNK